MISENQFSIGHLSPKLFNHLGINEIYQDPRQNLSLNISHNAIPRPLINSHYTLTFINVGFHDWLAKHLSKAWFHIWIILGNRHIFFNYTHVPHLAYSPESRDEILFKGGRLWHLWCQFNQNQSINITSHTNELRKLK